VVQILDGNVPGTVANYIFLQCQLHTIWERQEGMCQYGCGGNMQVGSPPLVKHVIATVVACGLHIYRVKL